MNFRALEIKLNTIRNNDLRHLEARLKDLGAWVRAVLIVFAGGFLGLVGYLIWG